MNRFPPSFPTPTETAFLHLLLCPDAEFVVRWNEWKTRVNFDTDVNGGTFGLIPLLSTRLKQHNITEDPAGRIHGIRKYAWVKNQFILKEADRAIKLLAEHNIDVMMLKGLPLLLSSYKDMGARMTTDADLLVRLEDAGRALDLLKEAFPQAFYKSFPIPHKIATHNLLRFFKETPFKAGEVCEIDLHWQVFSGLKMPASFVWAHAERQTLPSGTTYFAPSPEDQFLHVIVHGISQNAHRPLRWVADAAFLLRSHALNWDHVLERTLVYNIVGELQLAMRYFTTEFSEGVPESFLAKLYALPLSEHERAYVAAFVSKPEIRPFHHLGILWHIYRDQQPSQSFPAFILDQYNATSVCGFIKKVTRKLAHITKSVIRSIFHPVSV